MTRSILIVTAALILALMAGCARYTLVDPAKAREVGGVLRVDPQIAWSAYKEGKREVWTVNGTTLQAITFLTGIEDGDPLVAPRQGGKKGDLPTFRDGMRATDVVDLFEAQLISQQYSQIETRALAPQDLGGTRGFRFEYTAFNRNGLAKRGLVVGLIDEAQGLSLAIFEAAAEHYYDEYAGKAEAVLGSIEKI